MSDLTGYEQGFRWEKQRADRATARVRELQVRASEVAKELREKITDWADGGAADADVIRGLITLADRLEGSDDSGQEPRREFDATPSCWECAELLDADHAARCKWEGPVTYEQCVGQEPR